VTNGCNDCSTCRLFLPADLSDLPWIVNAHTVTGMASKGEIGATLPPPAAVPHKRPTVVVYPTGESEAFGRFA
jgi:hypothetical protein